MIAAPSPSVPSCRRGVARCMREGLERTVKHVRKAELATHNRHLISA